jgi:hypothetical protein
VVQKRSIAILGLLTIGSFSCPARFLPADGAEVSLQVTGVEGAGQVQDGPELKLDLRYAPMRWQACIGLPDDPHKSIIGSDGGLYYDYGGGRFHDFKVRVRGDLETTGQEGLLKQRLMHAGIPVVISEKQHGGLLLRQRAWANAPDCRDPAQWSRERVDYLWLELENSGNTSQRGRIVLEIDSEDQLQIDRDMQRVLYAEGQQTFCQFSPKCASCLPDAGYEDNPARRIAPTRPPSVNLDWGRPDRPCDERFRNVLVGYRRPLGFTFPAESGETYRVAFGLIESWHEAAGRRPLELWIEDQAVRRVDLVAEYGQHQPVVLQFDAADQNGDGLLEMEIRPIVAAEDQNTVLAALWIFGVHDAPSCEQILMGQADSHALAIYDANSRLQNPLRLFFAEKNLEPGQKEQVLVAIGRGEEADISVSVDMAQQELDRTLRYWTEDVNLPFDRIRIPDAAVQDLLDSCVRNIYQARERRNGEPAFQVGPTRYRGTWAADGPFILEAVTYLGRAQEARAGLELQLEKDEGPSGIEFSKKHGLRLWMILRHWQLTGDDAWLKTMWPKVQFNVEKVIEYRRMTMQDPLQANYGLMPIGFGDGGLGGRHREYTNVYWTLAGLKAAIAMAEHVGEPAVSEWKAEFADYWAHFDKARHRDKLRDEYGNEHVPVTMKGEEPQLPQRGAWAFLHSIYPGHVFAPDDELMRGTLAMLDAHQREGLIYGTGWDPAGIWTYAGSFYGHAHLWLGHGEKSAATFYAFANHACPLLCWWEEQSPRGESEKYVGDMPHNWASAEFIRLIRHMLILERGRELHLLEGMPHVWSRPGDTIRLTEIPTSFGPVSLSVHVAPDGRTGWIRVRPPQRERVDNLVVHLEQFDRPIRLVRKDDQEIGDELRLTAIDEEIVLALDFAHDSH